MSDASDRQQPTFQQEIANVEMAIAALEAQRHLLGDLIVDTALAPLREKLATLIQPDQAPDERKRVTVLFADVSGYTALSENLDPEDVAAIMNRLFEAVTVEIHRYGGTVDKYSGDAVMALFGAPQAIENHEDMAVRAALAMQEAVTKFSAGLEEERGFSLRMRIGLNTGEVLAGLVGGLKARSYTVMGDTVNLASRLEHACPVGRIMISATTAQPLQPVFDFEPPQQITVKGKTDPITVYLVVGEKVERGRVRGLAGLHAPMVGREAELAALQETFAQAVEKGFWQATAIIGDAGIGKSRLQREFIAWVNQTYPQTRILTSRCYTHTKTTPYYFIAELMRTLFHIGPDAKNETAMTKIINSLQTSNPTLDEPEFRYQLGSLVSILGLSIPDDPMQGLNPEQRRDRTFLSLERILDTASANTPLLILIDDLHWADVLSLGFTDRLIQMIGQSAAHNRSAMFLFLCRPVEEAETNLGQLLAQLAQPPHRTLRLTALDINQSEKLIAALLDQNMPADLRHLVIEHAQGNPFYVEEVLRSFIEDGTLRWEEMIGEWQVARAVSDVRIPTSVQDVLAARIDRLPPNDKKITQRAAIIGRTFWQHLLMQIVGARNVESTLSLLEMRQLADRLSQSQIAEDWEWVFRHVLIQEVAYAMVPKAVRRSVHQQVAHYLEAQIGEQTTFLFPLIAYHYEQGNLPEKAIEYLLKAGDQAAARFANEDAVDYFGRAMALLDKLPKEARRAAAVKEQQYALLLGREGVFRLLAQRDGQASDLVQLQALADELDNNHYRAEVALRFANYYDATSDFSAALIVAQNAVRWAEQAADPARKVEGLIAGAQALWRRGVYQEARPQLDEALALARQHGNQRGEANSLHQLGTVLYFLGDPQAARNYLEQALSLRRALRDIAGEAGSLNNIVAVYHGLGDFAKAKACCEQSLNIYRMIGNQRDEATALNNLGVMHHTLGNFDDARDYHERALALFGALSDRRGESLAANNLGLAFHDLGDYEKARHYCEQALTTRQSIGDRRGQGYSLTYLGLALEGLGELAEAHTAYDKAMHLRRDIGQAAAAIDDLAGLARIALKQNQPAQAETYAEETRQWIREHGIQGIVHPLRVYLTCADVAAASGKTEQATEVLRTAHDLLLEQAARISDQATRQAFLENVPIHNEILNRLAHAADSARS